MVFLREATFSDYTAIAQLHADSWKKTYRGILSEEFLENEVDADRLNSWYIRLKDPPENQRTVIAFMNNTMVGFCCAFLNDDPAFGTLIDNLHVSSTAQKSGIGRTLLTDLAQYICEKCGDRRMYLWVYPSNTNARIFYERLGGIFAEEVEKPNDDGTTSLSCRYTWENSGTLLVQRNN
jgi:ribosomal protein S18 acetylase RimI-like enzyme